MKNELEVGLKAIPDCLKTVQHWGEDIVYDLCSAGTSELIIPWGFADYALWTMFLTFIAAVILTILFAGVCGLIAFFGGN